MERLNGVNNWSWRSDPTYRQKADPLHSRAKHHMPARTGDKRRKGAKEQITIRRKSERRNG